MAEADDGKSWSGKHFEVVNLTKHDVDSFQNVEVIWPKTFNFCALCAISLSNFKGGIRTDPRKTKSSFVHPPNR